MNSGSRTIVANHGKNEGSSHSLGGAMRTPNRGLRRNRVGFSDKTPQTFQTLGATRGDHVTREERSLNRKHYTFAVDV